MNHNKFLILIACNLIVFSATAQTNKRDSIIPNQTIEIEQIYKPEIAKPVKPVITPSIPKIAPAKPKFDYVVPQQTLSYSYHSVPIRPLALGKQEFIYPFENYIKAGMGNLSSIYFDAGVGSIHDENYNTSFHFAHLSQNKVNTQKGNSNTTIDASGEYKFTKHTLYGAVDFFHKRYKYYGFNEDLYQYSNKSIRQAFTGGAISLGLVNTSANELNISYKPEINFGMYGDRFDAREQYVEINLPATYSFDENYSASLGLKTNITALKRGVSNVNNNYFQINPAFNYHSDQLQVKLALSPTLGKGNSWYFLPDIALRSTLFNNGFALVAGWKGDLIQNTYQELSSKNPFIDNLFPSLQTKSDYVFGGFETKFGEHLSFGATVNWKQWKNLALFVNDYTLNPDGKKFATVYDQKVQSLGLDAYFRYQISQVFGLHLESSWNSFYKTTTFAKAWHEPQVKFKAAFETRPIKNLSVTASLDYWDRIFALQANGTAEKLPAFLDLGVQAEYQIIPRFSVFLQLNNILNNKYEIWQQYEHYGFNVLGGFRFKF